MAADALVFQAFATAGAHAPAAPGVYLMLGARGELLYVGKAGNLRRRLQQHARAAAGGRSAGGRMASLYRRVREVRWELAADDGAAAAREADLIVALQPPFNASHVGEGRWAYVVVGPGAAGGDGLRFTLSAEPAAEPGPAGGTRAYGCFPHLGRGVSSRPGIACSDGYTAFLRLLWAVSGTPGHLPRRISRSAPDRFDVPVPQAWRPSLHAFLSGTSSRLLTALAVAPAHPEPYLRATLGRDLHAAEGFYTSGPRALRRLRLRHRLPPGPVPREVIERLLAAELAETIGAGRSDPHRAKSSGENSFGSTSTSQLPELSRRTASTPYGRSDGGWTNSTPLADSSS